MALKDIFLKKVVQSKSTEVLDKRPVSKVITTCAKIPMSERKFSKFFKPEVTMTFDSGMSRTNFRALLKGYLSKNPHLKFLRSQKSTFNPVRCYIFLDTSSKIEVAVSKEDLSRQKLHKRNCTGAVNIYLKERNGEYEVR